MAEVVQGIDVTVSKGGIADKTSPYPGEQLYVLAVKIDQLRSLTDASFTINKGSVTVLMPNVRKDSLDKIIAEITQGVGPSATPTASPSGADKLQCR